MLETYREEINQIDSQIIALFAQRFEIVKKIGEYKKEQGLPIRNPEREAALLKTLVTEAAKVGISEQFVEDVWGRMFLESYRIES